MAFEKERETCYNEIGDFMISIAEKAKSTISIQKSKFICEISPLTSLQDIPILLKKAEEEYPGATHYCYAYLFDQQKRFSDDGEPSGTAGMPLLNVIEAKGLDHILILVIRYFGGIKLGAGGLVRAYTKAATTAIEQAKMISLISGNLLKISFPYREEKRVLNLLFPYPILEKDYQEQVSYILFLPKEYLLKLKNYSYQILEENILGQEKKA